jgi:hypothetical protein
VAHPTYFDGINRELLRRHNQAENCFTQIAKLQQTTNRARNRSKYYAWRSVCLQHSQFNRQALLIFSEAY